MRSGVVTRRRAGETTGDRVGLASGGRVWPGRDLFIYPLAAVFPVAGLGSGLSVGSGPIMRRSVVSVLGLVQPFKLGWSLGSWGPSTGRGGMAMLTSEGCEGVTDVL